MRNIQKNFIIILLGIMLTTSGLFGQFAGGNGTANSPYQITTAVHLDNVRNYLGSVIYFKLMNDIDLTSYLGNSGMGYNAGAFWNSIGDYDHQFKGVLDGNNKKISGLKINRASINYIGLFGCIGYGAKLHNIKIEIAASGFVKGSTFVGGLVGRNLGTITNCSVIGAIFGFYSVGGLVGYNDYYCQISNSYSSSTVNGIDGTNSSSITCSGIGGLVGYNSGTIDNCYATGSVTGVHTSVGGLVGDCSGPGTIIKSHSTGQVSGHDEVGGLVGFNNGDKISDSYSKGNVNGNGEVGGLIGNVYHGLIENCYSTGSVTGTDVAVGGLAGFNLCGVIKKSYSIGAVKGTNKVGGLVGFNEYVSSAINDSYSISSVSGTSDIGGIVGNNNGNVTNAYAVGVVSGTGTFIGGLIGTNNGTVNESYWNKQTTGQTVSSGSLGSYGKTTAQMKLQATYVGWEFPAIWSISPSTNSGYPYLSDPNAPSLTITPKTISISENPGIFYFNIISNIDWTISYDANWITITTTNGSGSYDISVLYNTNQSTSSRIGTITVTGGGFTRTCVVTQSTGVGIEDQLTILPAALELEDSYPNPFNPTTTIKFALPKDEFITLSVYNLKGEEVAKLANGQFTAGYHTLDFNAENLTSGVYIYTLQTAGKTMVNKMLLVK